MKIALFLTSLANAGPIVVANDLSILLTGQGHDVSVFYFKNIVELDFPCSVTKISLFSKFNFDDYDVIHCHGLLPDIFVLLRKPLLSKTPVCSTIHSYLFQDHAYKYGENLAWLTGRLVLYSTKRDDMIITLSKHAMNYYKSFLPVKKLTYAYNSRYCKSEGISNVLKEEIFKFKGTSFLLGSNCVISRRKGLHQIIEVLPLLPDVKLCIIGDGKDKIKLEELVNRLNLEDRVLFLGRQEKAYRFLYLYDCFVMPSYSEGFPLALLEAASCKKATICSDIPIFREILTESETSFFKLDNRDSLVSAINRVIKERESLENNIYTRYKGDYSPECFLNRHIEIYTKLINGTR